MKAVAKYSFEDSNVAEVMARLIRGVTGHNGALSYFEEVHIIKSCPNIEYAKALCEKSRGIAIKF